MAMAKEYVKELSKVALWELNPLTLEAILRD